jgi:hypothetical protein
VVAVIGVEAGVERSTAAEEFAGADSRLDLTSEQPAAVTINKPKIVGVIILMPAFIYRRTRSCQAELVEHRVGIALAGFGLTACRV